MINKSELRIGNLVVVSHESNAPIIAIESIGKCKVNAIPHNTFGHPLELLLPIE